MPAEPAERVRAVIERVLDTIDVEAEIEIEETEEMITARVGGEEDLGLLIGRHGQTIDALQLLCYRAAWRGLEDRKRVIVDAAGYRERRQDMLSRQADSAAQRALQSGNPVELEPMSSQERRVVHDHLKERAEIETYSEGDEPDRRVIVAPLVEG
ncbi:MAG: RNA-binding cell elongation regulator Jag/EloR [Solirubrobacterales bacterium]